MGSSVDNEAVQLIIRRGFILPQKTTACPGEHRSDRESNPIPEICPQTTAQQSEEDEKTSSIEQGGLALPRGTEHLPPPTASTTMMGDSTSDSKHDNSNTTGNMQIPAPARLPTMQPRKATSVRTRRKTRVPKGLTPGEVARWEEQRRLANARKLLFRQKKPLPRQSPNAPSNSPPDGAASGSEANTPVSRGVRMRTPMTPEEAKLVEQMRQIRSERSVTTMISLKQVFEIERARAKEEMEMEREGYTQL